MARELRPCGTDTAYIRHYKRGEKPCELCRTEYNKRKREPTRLRNLAEQQAFEGHMTANLVELLLRDFDKYWNLNKWSAPRQLLPIREVLHDLFPERT